MSRFPEASFDSLPGFSRFYMDHAAGRLPDSLRPAWSPEDPAAWAARREARGPFPVHEELASALRIEHRRLGASAASLKNLEALVAGRAMAIVTGQQPGVFGGPMHTRLKIATAVALAARVSERHSIPCVPVYWNGADDADFDEVSHVWMPGPDLSILKFALSAEGRTPRGWVGDIPLERVRAVFEQAAGLFAAHGEHGTLAANIAAPTTAERDFGDWMSRICLELFAEDGLVVADARLPEIRRAAVPLFERYLDDHAAVHAALHAQSTLMIGEGYPPQLDADSLETALFLTPDRERLRLSAEETFAEARRALATHPSHLSPNVILRPLVTDTVFPTLAHVAGPSEYVYLGQLAPVYARLEVFQPIVVDRLSLTLMPAEAMALAATLTIPPGDLLKDPEEALRRAEELKVPAAFRGALSDAETLIGDAFAGLRKASTAIDASLVQQIDSARDKAMFQLGRVSEGVRKKIKHQGELAAPRLRHLADFLSPRRKPQERQLAALTFELASGPAAQALIAEVADRHVRNLFNGKRGHTLVDIP